MRAIWVIALTTVMIGCSTINEKEVESRSLNSDVILVDLHHGSMESEIRTALEEAGFSLVKNDTALSDYSFRDVGVLWLTDAAGKDYDGSEIKAIRRFVRNGGKVIVSGQAWSWSYDKENDLMEYPLNQVGESLGFIITGKNIGKPVTIERSRYLSGLSELKHTDWWPSQIDVPARLFKPLIRDESMRTMAVYIPVGAGGVFVFGHDSMLRDNPELVIRVLSR